MFRLNTYAVPDESAIAKNKQSMKDFIAREVFEKEFPEHIGYSAETDDLDIWPQEPTLKQIVKKIKLKSPKLVMKKIGENKFENLDIVHALLRRFGDERRKKREELQLPAKLKGIIKGTRISG